MPRRGSIYLDANATTPLDAGVRAVMVDALEHLWANPSSVHRLGREARVILDSARERLAGVLGCRPSEVIFTSGGTEANNLAVLGAARRARDRGRHLICSATEHPAVRAAHRWLAEREGFTLTELPVDSDGRVQVDSLRRALRPDTVLVSVMAANNEVGTLQSVTAIGALCREKGILFHCDAVQWFGKQPWPGWAAFPADLVPICSHKFHGPKGAGALLVRSPLPVDPLLMGGSQEQDRRAGTENLPALLGLVEAAERFVNPPVFPVEAHLELTRGLERTLEALPGVHLLSPRTGRLPNTVAFTVEHTDSIALLANLDLEGICASSGSACSAGSVEPSHVVRAMGRSATEAAALVRFSLDRGTTAEELALVQACLPAVIRRSQGCWHPRTE